MLLLVVARQLDKHTVGYVTLRLGFQTSMNSTIVRETNKNRAVATVQVRITSTQLIFDLLLMAQVFTVWIITISMLFASSQLGLPSTFVVMSYTRKLMEGELKLKATLRLGAIFIWYSKQIINRQFLNLRLPLTTMTTYSICTVLASLWSYIFLNANWCSFTLLTTVCIVGGVTSCSLSQVFLNI